MQLLLLISGGCTACVDVGLSRPALNQCPHGRGDSEALKAATKEFEYEFQALKRVDEVGQAILPRTHG